MSTKEECTTQGVSNRTSSLIVVKLTTKTLNELSRDTSVRWRTGHIPDAYRPRGKSYLAFDKVECHLTHHPVSEGTKGGTWCMPGEFVQSVARMCPTTRVFGENHA